MVKKILEMIRSTQVADSSKAFKDVASGTLKIETLKSISGIIAINADTRLPQTYHLEGKKTKFE
jgi:hypothetical protein